MIKIERKVKKICLFFALLNILASCKGNGIGKDENSPTPHKPYAKDIVIESVTLEKKACKEGSTVMVEEKNANLSVVFKEKYEDLKVIVNGEEATISEKEATLQLNNLTTIESEIKIIAKAKNKNDRTYSFKAQLMSQVEIAELKFIGDALNPSGTGLLDKKTVTYSSDPTKPPFLSSINKDGSTKIGSTKSFELEVWVMFKDEAAKERTLKIENKTNNKTTTTKEIQNKTLQAKIPLKNGENQLVITYSEKDKKSVSYSVKVDYEEPEYNPIYQIKINGKSYSSKEALEKLIAGTESMNVEGASKLPITIVMKEIWYKDEGWTVKIDGQELSKDKFERTGSGSYVNYEANVTTNLSINEEKLVRITFENTSRENYLKEYKINIKHTLLHKIADLIFIEEKINTFISGHKFTAFEKDGTKTNQFNLRNKLQASDWASKVLFLLNIESENVIPKYTILAEKKDPETIQNSDWKDTEKKNITYTQYFKSIEKEGFVAISEIEYETSYLYILLEGDGAKMFYTAEIMRNKEKEDEVGEDQSSSLFLNADDENTILKNKHPLSTKIIAKIRPKNPRAKVKILEPEEKELNLNVNKTYLEYTLPLKNKTATLKYKIFAEDGVHESNIKTKNFYLDPVISSLKFNYKAQNYGMKTANTKNGEYYIPVIKNNVEENKIYLQVNMFAGTKISSDNFLDSEIKEDNYSSTYTCSIDISSILDGVVKDCEGTLTLEGKNAGILKLHLFKANEDIEAVKIAYFNASEFPNNEYEFTKMMDANNGENIFVILHKKEGETKDNTKQKVVILYNSEEKELGIDMEEATSLKFKYESLKLPKGVDAELIIKYYKDKDDTTAKPKEYKLKINNRKA